MKKPARERPSLLALAKNEIRKDLKKLDEAIHKIAWALVRWTPKRADAGHAMMQEGLDLFERAFGRLKENIDGHSHLIDMILLRRAEKEDYERQVQEGIEMVGNVNDDEDGRRLRADVGEYERKLDALAREVPEDPEDDVDDERSTEEQIESVVNKIKRDKQLTGLVRLLMERAGVRGQQPRQKFRDAKGDFYWADKLPRTNLSHKRGPWCWSLKCHHTGKEKPATKAEIRNARVQEDDEH